MRRGFTLLELAIVLTIGTILIPLLWQFGAYMQAQQELATFELDVAEAIPTLAEELRADGRSLSAGDGGGVAFARDGCTVAYEVNAEAVLVRRGAGTCPSERGLSRRVESIAWTEGGVDVVFARALRPHRVQRIPIFLPVPR